MVPLPENRVRVPAVERFVLAAWVMAPPPLAFKVIEEPVTFPFMAIPAPGPDWRVTAPVAVMVLPLATAMVPPLLYVSVTETVPEVILPKVKPLDVALMLNAPLDVPVIVPVRFACVTEMLPELAVNESPVAPLNVPAPVTEIPDPFDITA